MKGRLSGLQQLGRALMLPIAVLPIAGLLLRLGQPDVLDWPTMAAAGDAIFSNLGLMFAVGVAVGLARENHGAAGLAALVCFLVTTKGAETLMAVPASELAGLSGAARDLAAAAFRTRELAKLSVPVGLICGITAGFAYNRFSNITLPSYLSFFGGRRFVAIATGLAGVAFAAIIGNTWPMVEQGMDATSRAILGSGSVGLFVYGVLNRVLIITGLHHILNNLAWFILGDYHGATGDLKRFFAGDPTAGAFMSGFFPVMMFGLPGACLAMYRAAPPTRRAQVAGLLGSLALTSFLTGVTEPVEFTFMFLAPVLYALHAIATGVSMALMDFLGVRLGFSFSAGLFDYVLNFSHAQHPLWLLPIGAIYFGIYYAGFRYCIVRFNLATPGREPEDAAQTARPVAVASGSTADAFIEALGGAGNLTEVEACTTRLRLGVVDGGRVNEAALKQLGARGVVRPSANSLQVVLGPIADQVAGDIRDVLRAGAAIPAASVGHDAPALLELLGGRENVLDLAAVPGRLLLKLARTDRVNERALEDFGVRGVARAGTGGLQVLVAGAVENTAGPLRMLLNAR
ncbi:MAG: N-acetylglucosamine-specific PTS transporter subunit IIBC [Gammaproteobacteria bacterium]